MLIPTIQYSKVGGLWVWVQPGFQFLILAQNVKTGKKRKIRKKKIKNKKFYLKKIILYKIFS